MTAADGARRGGAAAPAAKTIVFCSDTTYPPMESLSGGKAVGADVDIASAVAKLLGATSQIKTTGFDVIIPALKAKKCDAIISALTNTPARAKEVDFANYVTVGRAPDGEEGQPVARHRARLAERQERRCAGRDDGEGRTRRGEQDALRSRGRRRSAIKIFPADTNAAAALSAGRVDAYFTDATPALFYIKKSGDKFETAGGQIDSAPEGIATRKGDPLGAQMKTAIAKLYANGTMKTILAKWGLSAFALKK